mmetsp:Transcript_790/g.1994  ORF Transcript_790/g.1994 Transcript_790/m.1994 type:complete len:215 (-) Transcript_790:168-812(-)
MADPFNLDGAIYGQAGEEEEESVVDQLKRVWKNERCAPNLLQYEKELVDMVKEALDQQQDYVDSMRKTMTDETMIFMLKLLELEVDRIRFVLRAYLRARMCKIQKYNMFLLSDRAQMDRMSSVELKACKAFTDAMEAHQNHSFVANIPENLRNLHAPDMIVKPDMDSHVFIKVLKNVGSIRVEDEDVEMNKDEIVLVNYSHVEGLIERGEAAMV